MAPPDVTAAVLQPAPDPDRNSSRREALVESYRRLADVFHHVLSEQSLDALLDRIADTLADLVPYDALHIYEADLARRELVPVLARSDWESQIMGLRPKFGEGITGWAVANRTPVLSNQAHLDPRVAFVPGTPVEPEALISIPLVARASLKGALNIYRVGGASFDADEFELAKWFGDAAALALDNAQVRARLEHQAKTDSLTGLYNHRYFHERLRAELTRANRVHDRVALLMCDIDDFKRVNDICGHGVGDDVLIVVGELLSSLVRASDAVCRLGGEEFAVIMPSCDAADGIGLARRLAEQLKLRPVDGVGDVTVSVGIACGPDHATNPRELVASAESAMMTAKARGKDRIVVFDENSTTRPSSYDSGRDARPIAHLKMLQSVAGRLSRLSTVKEIAEVVVNELRMLIDYHSCRVYLVEGDELVPVAVKGELDEHDLAGIRVKLGAGVVGTVAVSGRSLLVPDALGFGEAIQIPGTDRVDESVVAVPLRYGSRVSGVVFLSKLGVGQLDEDDQRLLEVVAGYAAVSLENARLYESLRREADHAKAWLAFADAMSRAGSFEEACEETVRGVARLLELGQCALWLESEPGRDYVPVASVGYREAPDAERILEMRIDCALAEANVRSAKVPFVRDVDELRAWFPPPPGVALVPTAFAPLDPGYGVRGWIAARAPEGRIEHFTEERLRLLEGLAYRASMALQKAHLHRAQQESAEVANALLGFARALAEADELAEIQHRIVDRSARILGVREASLWLQDVESGDLVAEALHGVDGAERARALATRYPREVAELSFRDGRPYLISPAEYERLPDFHEPRGGGTFGVAPFRFDGGRLGFLAVGPVDDAFGDLQLEILHGLADQAKLAIAGAR